MKVSLRVLENHNKLATLKYMQKVHAVSTRAERRVASGGQKHRRQQP